MFAPRAAAAFCLAFALTFSGGCTPAGETKGQAPAPAAIPLPAPTVGTLEWAAAGPWRIDPERDAARHPVQTLKFFGIAPNMTVVEVLPGRGWYTAVLAPYLAAGGGKLYAAHFDVQGASEAQLETLAAWKSRFLKDPETFGAIILTSLSPASAPIAPAGTADAVLVVRNVHTLLAEGYAEKAFREFYAALKPGGVLGVVQHRARSTGVQDPRADNGYVQEAFVKLLAEEAGFEFEEASEVNANPNDDRDHPYGVWSLPPVLRTSPLGEPPNPKYDTTPYEAIGESDRMTLRFRKPKTGGT